MLRMRRLPEAIENLTAATLFAPDFSNGWRMLSNALRLDGQLEIAVDIAVDAAERWPKRHELHYALSLARRARGEIELAETSLRTAAALAPRHPLYKSAAT